MSAYSDQVIADGAVGYWRMDASSGTNETDRSGQSHGGTISGGATLNQQGAISDSDTAILLDGVNGRMLIGSGLNPWSGDFTLEAWMKVVGNSPTQQVCLHKESFGVNGFRMGWVKSGSKWQFWTNESGGSISINTTGTANTWALLSVTHSSSTFAFYVNGSLINTSTSSYVAPAGGLEVGGIGAGWPFNGIVDEVSVYSTPLTAANIANHYALGLSAQIPSRLFWSF